MDTASPCVKMCTIDLASGLCAGCWRTLAEIAAWSRLHAGERRRIIDELPDRRVRARPGG